MSAVVRLVAHPSEDRLCVLVVAAQDAAAMSGFAAARYSDVLRGYLLPRDLLGEFSTYARVRGLLVSDETSRATHEPQRKPVGTMQTRPLPECSVCSLPVPRDVAATLRVCPHCGAAWYGVVFDSLSDLRKGGRM